MFDHEPAHYAAISLHRDGFVVAPESLEFAQEELDKFNRGHHELKQEVLSKWKALDKTLLDHLTLKETPVDVQLGKLSAVFAHIAENAARLIAEL
jgi:hypothetical protein